MSNDPKKISAVMIVKNESAILSRCLESIKGIDEIIICDTGSEDNTVEIARKYTPHIFTDYQWNDNFAEARNHALSKATGDWILVIDADEILHDLQEVRESVILAERIGAKGIKALTIAESTGVTHWSVRVHKRDPSVYWVGAIHNHLTEKGELLGNVQITYGYSPAHFKDPDRSLRILEKECKDDTKVRERFYLGREYFYKKRYEEALDWLNRYVIVSQFPAEKAEAYLLMAKIQWMLSRGNEARRSCLEAININPDFKEALVLMGTMHYEPHKSKWLRLASYATNKDVLFVRTFEQGSDYYDKVFTKYGDLSRYDEIHQEVGKLVGDSFVVDIGCGMGEVSKYIKNYSGFDFSDVGIQKCKEKNLDVWKGLVYDPSSYKPADVYISLEVLEHVDDMKVFENIPSGKRFIFSVPNFSDPAHLRLYTPSIIEERYGKLGTIHSITVFSWSGKWEKVDKPGNQIYLVDFTKV